MFFGKRSEEEDDGSQTQRKIFFVNMLQKSLAESVFISFMDSKLGREGVLMKKKSSMAAMISKVMMIL